MKITVIFQMIDFCSHFAVCISFLHAVTLSNCDLNKPLFSGTKLIWNEKRGTLNLTGVDQQVLVRK